MSQSNEWEPKPGDIVNIRSAFTCNSESGYCDGVGMVIKKHTIGGIYKGKYLVQVDSVLISVDPDRLSPGKLRE